jgi:hypothetical protein
MIAVPDILELISNRWGTGFLQEIFLFILLHCFEWENWAEADLLLTLINKNGLSQLIHVTINVSS